MKLAYKNFEIEVIEDKNYNLNSTDNFHHYQKVYFKESEFRANCKYAIIIKEYGVEISSVIICEGGSPTGIFNNSFIIEDDKIWIRICNKIYCLEIPTLKLIWQKEFDEVTNFCFYKLGDDFLIHGELEIFRITKEGEIIWSFGGRDIWFNPIGHNELTIEENKIRLFDFESNEYILDFEGKELEFNPRIIETETKKKWWQIFG